MARRHVSGPQCAALTRTRLLLDVGRSFLDGISAPIAIPAEACCSFHHLGFGNPHDNEIWYRK